MQPTTQDYCEDKRGRGIIYSTLSSLEEGQDMNAIVILQIRSLSQRSSHVMVLKTPCMGQVQRFRMEVVIL